MVADKGRIRQKEGLKIAAFVFAVVSQRQRCFSADGFLFVE